MKIKKIVRAHIRDFKLEPVMVFSLKELWGMTRQSTALAFCSFVSIRTKGNMLERHGEK